MITSANGRAKIAQREGNILHAYKDTKGILTIGVGHTSAAGQPTVTPGMTITAAQSDEILARDLKDCENRINSLVKVPLTQNQFDALVSFVFNIGWPHFSTSTVLKKLNLKDYKGAADAFDMWRIPPEITGRRNSEKAQFLS